MEANREQPFFLYLAHSFPHVPLYASDRFRGSTERGLYGDVIAEIDASLGVILGTLDRLGLADNTIVVYTSDNGPWLVMGNHGGSALPYREGKATTFEGGHRVPALVRWPGRIPAGAISDVLVTAMDLTPTITRLAGVDVPEDLAFDGHDIWPVLENPESAESPYDHFYYFRSGQLRGVRSGRWKLHVPHTFASMVGGEAGRDGMPGRYNYREFGPALFDLVTDPGETHNIFDQHPEVVNRLQELVEQGRAELGDALTETVGTDVRPPGRVNQPWAVQVDGRQEE
jgi:arylsulfatase A-like enzyme